jgi:hypothetical protein
VPRGLAKDRLPVTDLMAEVRGLCYGLVDAARLALDTGSALTFG